MRFDNQEIRKRKTSVRKARKVRTVSFAGQAVCFLGNPYSLTQNAAKEIEIERVAGTGNSCLT
jgi:hypothetical protein